MDEFKIEEIKEVIDLKSNNIINIHTNDINKLKNRLEMLNEMAETIKSTLKNGIDYGIIPNTKGKPTLLKAGGQKIALLFGLIAKFKKSRDLIDYQKKMVDIEFECSLFTQANLEIAQGIGSTNSEEKKYKYDSAIAQINTITKIAKKRAFIDAILMIGNLSEVFTQDLEEMNIQDSNKSETKNFSYDKKKLDSKDISMWTKKKAWEMPFIKMIKQEDFKDAQKNIILYFKQENNLPKELKYSEFNLEQILKFNDYIKNQEKDYYSWWKEKQEQDLRINESDSIINEDWSNF